jgi:uncharacterized membrane protein
MILLTVVAAALIALSAIFVEIVVEPWRSRNRTIVGVMLFFVTCFILGNIIGYWK